MLVDFLAVWPLILSLDFARYALAAGLLSLLLLALRQRLRARQIRDTAVPPAQLRSEIAASLRTVLVFSLVGFVVHAGMKAGVLGTYGCISEYGWTYFAASVLLAILAHDAYFYWTHRLMHQPRLFSVFHRQHHRSVRPTAWAAYSFDAAEAVVQAAFLPLFLLVVPMHDLAILLFLTHMIARNVIGHCGVELFPRRAADKRAWAWTTTVTHHDLHHESFRYNYGLYFTWWDRLMGTEHPQYRRRLAGAGRALAAGAAFLALVGAQPAPALAGEPAQGVWATPGVAAKVRIEECSVGRLCGRIVWLWDARDERGLLGVEVLRDFHRGADGRWAGVAYNPEDGRTYSATLHVGDAGELRLHGCVLSVLCQTQVWRRESDLCR